MRETTLALLESELVNNINITSDYSNLVEINENQVRLLGFTPEKVVVMKQKEGPYLIEFANNLERFMVENDITLESAIDQLENLHNIDRRSIYIVMRESDIGKLDIGSLKEEFNFCRFPD